MYFRGTLNFALHYFYDAITDFETVIEKSEETNAKHYLARGRCYACLSMFKEAITDLSIAINLNKDLLDVTRFFLHTYRLISIEANVLISLAIQALLLWTSKSSLSLSR